MVVTLKRIASPFHFEAANEEGNSLQIDASPSIGGTGQGFRPMQLLLAGLAGCSAIDIVDILRKGRSEPTNIEATVNGEREAGKTPSLFNDIQVHYVLYGDLDTDKVKRAIDLSLGKYCSVAKTLEPTAKISYTFQIMK